MFTTSLPRFPCLSTSFDRCVHKLLCRWRQHASVSWTLCGIEDHVKVLMWTSDDAQSAKYMRFLTFD